MGGRAWTDPERAIVRRLAHVGWVAQQRALAAAGFPRTRWAIEEQERDLGIARPRRVPGIARVAARVCAHRQTVVAALRRMGHDPRLESGDLRRVDPYCVETFLRDEVALATTLCDFSRSRGHSEDWTSRRFAAARIPTRDPWIGRTPMRVPLALCEAVIDRGASWSAPAARAWRIALLHNDSTMAPWAAWVAATSPEDPPWLADATADARRFVRALRQQYVRWVAEHMEGGA